MFDRARTHRVDGRFAARALVRMRQMLLCLLTAGFAASSIAQEPRTVRVGVYQNSPKIDYTAAGKAEGIFIDILEAIAEKEGWKIVYVPGTWVEGLVRLLTGEVDLMPDTALTEEREKSYAYHHEPVLSQWNQIYTRRGSGIRTLIDLNGKRVALLDGSIQQRFISQMVDPFGVELTLVNKPDLAAAFNAVANKEADAVVSSNYYGLRNAAKYGLVDTAIIFSPQHMYFAAPRNADPRLLDAIDRHLADFKKDADSVYYRSLRRWAGETARTVLPAWFVPVAIGGALLLLISTAWAIALRMSVVRLRESEAQQRKLAAELEQIFEFTLDAICTFDFNGYFLTANAAFERILGHRPEELIGTHFKKYILPEDYQKTMEWGPQVLAGTAVLAFENRYLRKDGGVTTIQWSGQWSQTDQALYCVGHDVTERNKMMEDLQRRSAALERSTAELAIAKDAAEASDRLKSVFLATMSHELRTPLNSIIGFTGILLQGLAGPVNDEQKKQLGMVRSSSHHLLALINDVLDISKIEAGELTVGAALFDLPASIAKVAATIKPLADKKGLALNISIDTGVGEMTSDVRRVEQILLNLLSNAIKFTDKGSVTLNANRVADFSRKPGLPPCPAIRVRVQDTGIGIKPEDMAVLFKPFRQVDSALSRNHEGTGLGLTICRRLAELMGGMMEAESRWQEGSTFTVTLPLRPQDAPQAGRRAHPESSMGSA